MKELKCPSCGKGPVEWRSLPNYEARLGGMPFVVAVAEIAVCASCGEEFFSAEELKKWRKELRRQLQEKGALLKPEQVKEIRRSIGLGVADLAAILGVTRQTVHAWEREDTGGMQLGPAAILLGLLWDKSTEFRDGLLHRLIRAAGDRGQVTTVAKETDRASQGRVLLPGPTDHPARPHARPVPLGAPGFGRMAPAA